MLHHHHFSLPIEFLFSPHAALVFGKVRGKDHNLFAWSENVLRPQFPIHPVLHQVNDELIVDLWEEEDDEVTCL